MGEFWEQALQIVLLYHESEGQVTTYFRNLNSENTKKKKKLFQLKERNQDDEESAGCTKHNSPTCKLLNWHSWFKSKVV